MAEASTEPVGLWLGLQAGAFLGLYFGFSLALVSALTNPEELLRIVYLITIFPLVGGILLGPFLAKRERPVTSSTPPIQRTLEALDGMDEGRGKWRALSHVRSDGRTVRIDLHDSSRVEEILRLTTPLTNEFPIRYMVGRGVGGSRSTRITSKGSVDIGPSVSENAPIKIYLSNRNCTRVARKTAESAQASQHASCDFSADCKLPRLA